MARNHADPPALSAVPADRRESGGGVEGELKIFKYPIETTDVQTIQMPLGAQILCIQTQYNIPCIWAVVDPSKPMQTRHIWIYGTGHPMAEVLGSYIGTYQLQGGALVFHCFEERSAGRVA